jgi:hypothetical protein
MFKKIALTSIFAISILSPILSQAASLKMLEITSQSDPGKVSSISINYNDTTRAITSLSYKRDIKKTKIETVSIEDLLKEKQPIYEQLTVDVISLKAQKISPSQYIITMEYLYEWLGFRGIYKNKKLTVYFLTPSNRFEAVDLETNKTITKMYFHSHYVKGAEKGIEKIDTW